MRQIFIILYRIIRRFKIFILRPFDWTMSYLIFFVNGVEFSSFKNVGIPKIYVANSAKFVIDKGFTSNNREYANPIGRFNKCSFFVGKNAYLKIGENFGISSSSIFCSNNIKIGNNVKIGGNVVIYDTDFHSLDPVLRKNKNTDKSNVVSKPIKISNSVFIGAHSTILKGVNIGENSIIGAASVVSKDIPANEIWAGNPIKFIKKI